MSQVETDLCLLMLIKSVHKLVDAQWCSKQSWLKINVKFWIFINL